MHESQVFGVYHILADGSVELGEVRVGMQRKFDWGVAPSYYPELHI